MENNKTETIDRWGKMRAIAFAGSLGLLILLAFGLRTFHLGAQDIWWDEGRNIFTASRTVEAIAAAPELDIHPPLYFYLMHIWMALAGTREFAVRFFSLWFGVATVPLVYALGRYLQDRLVGWWAAFFIALAPILVDEAQQTRMYTLLLFLSTGSVYLLLRALNSGKRKYWIWYALTAVAALYAHYSFVYVLAAQNLYLAFEFLRRQGPTYPPTPSRKGRGEMLPLPLGKGSGDRSARTLSTDSTNARRDLLVHWAATQLSVAILYFFQVPNILRQLQVYGNPGMTPPTLTQYLSDLAGAFALGQKVEPAQTAVLGLGFVAALALGLAAAVVSRREALIRRDGLYILLWLVAPLVAYYIVLQSSPQFTPRYILVAVLPFYLLLSLFLAKLARHSIALGILPALVLLLAFGGAWQSLYFNPAFFTDDTRGLASFISEEATKDDIVFIDVPFPFDYYYRGAAPAHYLPVDIHSTADELTRESQNKKRLFFVRWYKSDTDPRGYVLYLLDKYAVFQGERELRGYDVVWYALPNQPRFSLAPSPQPAAANFGDHLMLTAFAYGGAATPSTPDVNTPRVALKSKLWVALWWITTQPVRENYKVSVVLRDAEGNTAAQDDRMLIDDRHLKTSLWNPLKETAINVYTPELVDKVKPGKYALNIIVYDPETGKRLAVGSADTFLLGDVEVVP